MTYFTKRYHPPGTAPGVLTKTGTTPVAPLKLWMADYNEQYFDEKILEKADDCLPSLQNSDMTWIHVQGDAEPETLRQLGNLFGLHPLALEDIINTGQRPKLDEFEEHIFLILAMPLLKADRVSVTHEQISFFVGKNFVISFCTGSVDPFEPVRKRLRSQAGKIRSRNSDYLLYALIDVIIDQGFPLLEWFGESIEDLEEELLANPDHDTLLEMHQIRRNLVLLRRMLWPQREVINRLTHNESHLLQEESRIYYADCYDHTIQIMDLVETYREMTTSMLDVYLSSASNKMNEVMRVLTVIATIFIPLTFLVGVYGMNFSNPNSPWDMPELKWYFGYPLLWLIMIAIAVGMLLWFRHKKWL